SLEGTSIRSTLRSCVPSHTCSARRLGRAYRGGWVCPTAACGGAIHRAQGNWAILAIPWNHGGGWGGKKKRRRAAHCLVQAKEHESCRQRIGPHYDCGTK